MINGHQFERSVAETRSPFSHQSIPLREFKISQLDPLRREYGRSSGSIMNVATRSGLERLPRRRPSIICEHNYFDARNFFNRKPVETELVHPE